MTSQESESTFVCNLNAIPAEFRALHEVSVQQLFASVQDVRVLSTGYMFQFPNQSELLQSIVAFISSERLCCPFFHFVLEIEPEQGPVWLSLTGKEDVKPFLDQWLQR